MIYKDANMMGDREVVRYIRDNALMQLLESQRLKEQIEISNKICGLTKITIFV